MYTYFTKRQPFGSNAGRETSTTANLRSLVLAILLIFSLQSIGQIAPVTIPTGGFHIDGDLKSNTPTPGIGDWVPGVLGTGGNVFTTSGTALDPTHSFLLYDGYNTNVHSEPDTIFSGSALNDDPNDWKWAASTSPDKNEINRGMIHLTQDGAGDVWLVLGADRLSTNGTAYIDFELLQNTMTKNNATGKFNSAGPDSGRTVNDLLITVLYNNGGGVSEIIYNRWLPKAGGGFEYQIVPAPGPLGFAVTNSNPVDVPFGAFGSTTYTSLQFVEAAVNLSQVINVNSGGNCSGLNIKTIFIKTKASTSSTAALKDFIDPLQVYLQVGGVTINPLGTYCINNGPVALSGTPAGGTFSSPDPGVSGTTFNPSVAGVGVHKIYYTKEMAPGCIRKDSTYATVQQLSGGGSVTGGTRVCSGTNSGTLTLSGYLGTIVKWQKSENGGAWTDIINTTASQSFSNLVITTSYRAVVQNGICAPANSTPATVTVDPPSVGGVVAGSATVCSGSNSGSLTLSGQTGNVIKWQQSVNGNAWTDINNTTNTQSYTNISQPTQFRAVVQSGSCASANSTPGSISVVPPSVGGSVTANASACGGANSGTLTLSGQTGNVVKWQKSVNGGAWTDIANTTTSQSYLNLVETTSFRAVVQSGSCAVANSTPATITIIPASAGGTITGSIIVCDNNPNNTLTLIDYVGTIIKWQSSTDGVNWVDIDNTTPTLVTGILTQRTYFRAVVQNGICAPVYSTPATVLIISCGPTGNHCTYTQGFYGNLGGNGCSGGSVDGNTMERSQVKMLKAFDIYGYNKVTFGRANIGGSEANDRAFTLFKDDISNKNIFKMLPGGGTAMVLGVNPGGAAYGYNYDGATYSNQSTWSVVPISQSGSTKGKIKNSLLAQTMTLFFNINNGTNLAGFELHDTLYVTSFDCITGDVIQGAPILQFGLPHEVIAYLAHSGGEYPKTVSGLYKLANDILGGVSTPGLSSYRVVEAVDKINNAFDGCRAMVGSFDLPLGSRLISIPYFSSSRGVISTTEDGGLKVNSFPNPYTDKVRFTLSSTVEGNGTLELYNMLGQKVKTLFEGRMIAGMERTIDYVVPVTGRGNYIYVFRLGSQKVSGKIIHPTH